MVFSPLRAFSVKYSRPYLPGQLGDLLAELGALLGLGERGHVLSAGVSLGSTSVDDGQDFSGGDLRAGPDVDLGDRAGRRRGHGVLHLHRLEHEDDAPAATCWPASTATFTTVPGIGASRLPLATASAGSTKRGTGEPEVTGGESTSTRESDEAHQVPRPDGVGPRSPAVEPRPAHLGRSRRRTRRPARVAPPDATSRRGRSVTTCGGPSGRCATRGAALDRHAASAARHQVPSRQRGATPPCWSGCRTEATVRASIVGHRRRGTRCSPRRTGTPGRAGC